MVEYQCEKCGKGTMCADGSAYLTIPPKYDHKCTNCGYTEIMTEHYPYLSYILDEEYEFYRQAFRHG